MCTVSAMMSAVPTATARGRVYCGRSQHHRSEATQDSMSFVLIDYFWVSACYTLQNGKSLGIFRLPPKISPRLWMVLFILNTRA